MRILIADDDEDSRRLLTVTLNSAGHQVVSTTDGESAWQAWQREGLRFLVTDWMMPELEGPELVRRIRSVPEAGYTYIVLLTALGEKPRVVTGLQAGADDYLTKPFDPDELLARVGIGERTLKLEASLQESRRRMEFLAMYDSLTGLLNRRAVQERAAQELNRAARERHPLGVVLMDVDHFKRVNDEHGHQVGDLALQLVARTVAFHMRPYDLLGRWGGEEFLVLLPGAGPEAAREVAERLRRGVATTPLRLPDGRSLYLNLSLGATTTPPQATQPDLDTLVRQADEALYRAKNAGRNRVCMHGEA